MRLTISSKVDQVAWAGVAVRAVAHCWSFDEQVAAELELAVVELINNCIEHAYQLQPGHPVELEIDARQRELTIEVRDRGVPHSRAGKPPKVEFKDPTASALDDLPEGGWGLGLVLSFVDSIEFFARDGWNVARILRKLNPTSSEEINAPSTGGSS
jgi:anti-sigma regulatory factor (Ser/Thr protein kinase)